MLTPASLAASAMLKVVVIVNHLREAMLRPGARSRSRPRDSRTQGERQAPLWRAPAQGEAHDARLDLLERHGGERVRQGTDPQDPADLHGLEPARSRAA